MKAPDPTEMLVKQPEPQWIGEALGTNVKSLKAKLLGEGRGFQSTTWRLELRRARKRNTQKCNLQ